MLKPTDKPSDAIYKREIEKAIVIKSAFIFEGLEERWNHYTKGCQDRNLSKSWKSVIIPRKLKLIVRIVTRELATFINLK